MGYNEICEEYGDQEVSIVNVVKLEYPILDLIFNFFKLILLIKK